jgi:hypothetical protein
VGHFDEPQCVQICPVSCIPLHPQWIEDRPTLLAKYRRLQGQDASIEVAPAPVTEADAV